MHQYWKTFRKLLPLPSLKKFPDSKEITNCLTMQQQVEVHFASLQIYIGEKEGEGFVPYLVASSLEQLLLPLHSTTFPCLYGPSAKVLTIAQLLSTTLLSVPSTAS